MTSTCHNNKCKGSPVCNQQFCQQDSHFNPTVQTSRLATISFMCPVWFTSIMDLLSLKWTTQYENSILLFLRETIFHGMTLTTTSFSKWRFALWHHCSLFREICFCCDEKNPKINWLRATNQLAHWHSSLSKGWLAVLWQICRLTPHYNNTKMKKGVTNLDCLLKGCSLCKNILHCRIFVILNA